MVAVGPRVASIAAAIAVGLFFANLAVEFGAIRRIGALAAPLARAANLPTAVGTAILATTASPTAGYGMLAEFREDGVLDDRATLVAVTINTVFGFVQHIFTFYAPVLIPILGLRVGLLYVGARAAVALAVTLTGVLAGALFLPERNVRHAADAESTDSTAGERAVDTPDESDGDAGRGERVRDSLGSTWAKLRDILPRLAVVYTLVVLLTRNVDLTAVASQAGADPLAAAVGLPAAAVPVIAVFAVDTTSGALAIAPLVPGVFTPEQAVATMLVGGVVSFAVSTFKRSIPFQYGIWGAEFGSKVIAVNVAGKVVFIAVALAILL
ncbi:hypothetical protein [Halocalculus aciditolerans]|uniref:hypothetical protein n=1 Tax=Halocalculus aciditolerans TaxID=1383812 RepID=UPI00166324CE